MVERMDFSMVGEKADELVVVTVESKDFSVVEKMAAELVLPRVEK